jgi:hypothetical protein
VDQLWSIATDQLIPALEELYAAVQQLNTAALLQELPQMVQTSGVCELTADAVTQLSTNLGARLAVSGISEQVPRSLNRQMVINLSSIKQWLVDTYKYVEQKITGQVL